MRPAFPTLHPFGDLVDPFSLQSQALQPRFDARVYFSSSCCFIAQTH